MTEEEQSQEPLSNELIEKIHNHADHFGEHNFKVFMNKYKEDFKEKFPEVAEVPDFFQFYIADFAQNVGTNALTHAFANLEALGNTGFIDSEGYEVSPIEAGLETFKKYYTKTLARFMPAGSKEMQ